MLLIQESPVSEYRFDDYFAGVYFTSVDPDNKPKSILLNNYDDSGHVTDSRKLWGKIKWVVEVVIPENEVEEITGVTNRDIYLYPEYDVVLSNYQHSIYRNPRA